MEKETELYLIQRIKELEQEIKNMLALNKEPQRKYDKPIIIPFNQNELDKALDNHFLAEYQGYDVNMLVRKATAYDMLNDLLGFEACVYPQESKYELVLWKIGGKVKNITKEQFEIMREVIDK